MNYYTERNEQIRKDLETKPAQAVADDYDLCIYQVWAIGRGDEYLAKANRSHASGAVKQVDPLTESRRQVRLNRELHRMKSMIANRKVRETVNRKEEK